MDARVSRSWYPVRQAVTSPQYLFLSLRTTAVCWCVALWISCQYSNALILLLQNKEGC